LDHLGDLRTAVHDQMNRSDLPRLCDYPLMHDQDELDFQFAKTLAALSKPEPEPERVGASVEYSR